jgi:hypothetical protein
MNSENLKTNHVTNLCVERYDLRPDFQNNIACLIFVEDELALKQQDVRKSQTQRVSESAMQSARDHPETTAQHEIPPKTKYYTASIM